eukprot:6383537-Pyramimonas_sp.AAC.1
MSRRSEKWDDTVGDNSGIGELSSGRSTPVGPTDGVLKVSRGGMVAQPAAKPGPPEVKPGAKPRARNPSMLKSKAGLDL